MPNAGIVLPDVSRWRLGPSRPRRLLPQNQRPPALLTEGDDDKLSVVGYHGWTTNQRSNQTLAGIMLAISSALSIGGYTYDNVEPVSPSVTTPPLATQAHLFSDNLKTP